MNLLLIVISVALTYLVYWLNKKWYVRLKIVLLSPIVVTPIVLILLLVFSGTSYRTYNEGAEWLTFLLGPATVSFAVPMHKHFNLLKTHFIEIISSVTVGSLAAIVSSFLFAKWLGLSALLVDSLVPRSITTPVAMDISKSIGGLPTLTAVFVIITGISGAVIGPSMIRILRIKESAAKGLMLGMSSHGAGTSKAFEIGELEGTFASLAMIVAAVITIVLALTIFPIIQFELNSLSIPKLYNLECALDQARNPFLQ